jgi:hypothetical protein
MCRLLRIFGGYAMKTENYTMQSELFMKEKSTSSAVDSPASRSVSLDEKKERKMTATSGRKCFESFSKRSPLGLLVKTLLTSSIWHSPARRLTWSMKATPCSHLLFQLVPSAHPTDETECGLLPTPMASDATQGAIIGKNDQYYITKTGMPRKINGQGTAGSVGLARLARLLPTMGANEFKGANRNRYVGSKHFRGAKMSEGLRTTSTDPIYLNPSFAEIVMGFPPGWTDLKHSETP